MAHISWIESDAHISWTYERAGIEVEDRVPEVLGGDTNARESTNLEGYEHRDRIIERMAEVADANGREPTRWDVIYEMSTVIVGHQRLADRQRMVDDGTLSSDAVTGFTAEDLRPRIRSTE